MKKSFIYILMVVMSMALTLSACSKFDANSEGIITPKDPDPTPQDKDTLKWDRVVDKTLPINGNMIATPWIIYEKSGERDSLQMESWLLDINTTDLVVYRDSYQPTTKSGKTPNAERSTEPEFKDKFGNMVTRHHYTQAFEFNNFMHSITGAWNTGYVVVNGKQEPFLPEDGLYYNVSYEVGDTVHFVRNDSIFAREDVKIKYTATLKVTAEKHSWHSWTKEATVTVVSFIGIVEHEEEIPTADIYIPSLLKGGSANRFPMGGSTWGDGLLIPSTGNMYYMLVASFEVKDGKETQTGVKLDSIAKSALAKPAADDPYDAVMWDPDRNRAIPCHISVDGDGFGLGVRYADGTTVTKKLGHNSSVMGGIKNLSEDDNATPTPIIATHWGIVYQKNGKTIYAVEWHTNGKDGKAIHSCYHTIADASLKK